MKLFFNTVKTGFIEAIKTTLTLMKVVLPVYAVVVILKYSPLMPFLEDLFRPAMGIFKLPSEAVVPLIAGVFTDEYGAIATASQFHFTAAELTTIAMFNLAFHSIPVEYALSRKIGLPGGKFVLYRFFIGIVIAVFTAWVGGVLL